MWAAAAGGCPGSTVTSKKPELQDFGVTYEQYALYEGTSDVGSGWGCLSVLVLPLSVAIPIGFFFETEWFWGTLMLSAVPFMFVGMFIVQPTVARFARSKLLNSPVASRIRKYEEARKAWLHYRLYEKPKAERAEREAKRAEWARQQANQEAERARHQKKIDYWMSLSGDDFERDMAALCRRLGYSVETTPASGDEGVDLVLRRKGKKIVVQCKSHKSPVGPAVVRELYGSMIAAKADKAVLACTGGFTRGVRDFAKGKPIELVSASGLVELAERNPPSGTDGSTDADKLPDNEVSEKGRGFHA